MCQEQSRPNQPLRKLLPDIANDATAAQIERKRENASKRDRLNVGNIPTTNQRFGVLFPCRGCPCVRAFVVLVNREEGGGEGGGGEGKGRPA